MKSIRPIGGPGKRPWSLDSRLMRAYRQLTAAFTAEVELDELQGAVEHLLDAVRAEAARIRTQGSRITGVP